MIVKFVLGNDIRRYNFTHSPISLDNIVEQVHILFPDLQQQLKNKSLVISYQSDDADPQSSLQPLDQTLLSTLVKTSDQLTKAVRLIIELKDVVVEKPAAPKVDVKVKVEVGQDDKKKVEEKKDEEKKEPKGVDDDWELVSPTNVPDKDLNLLSSMILVQPVVVSPNEKPKEPNEPAPKPIAEPTIVPVVAPKLTGSFLKDDSKKDILCRLCAKAINSSENRHRCSICDDTSFCQNCQQSKNFSHPHSLVLVHGLKDSGIKVSQPPRDKAQGKLDFDALLTATIGVQDGAQVVPEEQFFAGWNLRNTGAQKWGKCRVVHCGGESFGYSNQKPVEIDSSEPGKDGSVMIPLVAPKEQGVHQGFWRLYNDAHNEFGAKLTVNVVVKVKSNHKYAELIHKLESMGFSDGAKNTYALEQTNGDIDKAIALLLKM